MNKPVILTFIGNYLPGYKSGGPIRTLSNIIEHLGDEFDFRVVTLDRDAGDSWPYQNIEINQWNQLGKAQVFYVSPDNAGMILFYKIIKNTPFDIFYFNSFFNFTFTFKPLIVRLLVKKMTQPVILAPRGEFSRGALSLKKIKKKAYIAVSSSFNLFRGILWQASTETERDDIERQSFIQFKRVQCKGIHLATDISTGIKNFPLREDRGISSSGSLRILFLSRISPMKNLDYALNILMKSSINIIFDIYGPVADATYWKKCHSMIRMMPRCVEVSYHGCVAFDSVADIYSRYDLFFLPTLGENYGHVIVESLTQGTPVLISDRTPWKELAKEGLGWDFPLDNDLAFVHCIEVYSLLSNSEKALARSHIRQVIINKLTDKDIVNANRKMFLCQLQ